MPRVRKTTEKAEDTTNSKKDAPKPHQLYRSTTNRVIAGVAGGLGEYFAIDPTLVRLVFVLLALFAHGFGVLIYLVLWFLVPEKGQEMKTPHETIRENIQSMKTNIRNMRVKSTKRSYIILAGIILLLLFLFSDTISVFYGFSFHFLWPFLLILVGLLLLIKI